MIMMLNHMCGPMPNSTHMLGLRVHYADQAVETD
jgi:hypothetical protein